MEGIGGVLAFGIKDCHCRWHLVVGLVVVADDEVDAKAFGVGNLLVGLDAAVEYNHQFYALLLGLVNSLYAHPVALLISVGDIVVDI